MLLPQHQPHLYQQCAQVNDDALAMMQGQQSAVHLCGAADGTRAALPVPHHGMGG